MKINQTTNEPQVYATNYKRTKVRMYEIWKMNQTTNEPTNVRTNQPKVWTMTTNIVQFIVVRIIFWMNEI